MLFRVKLHVKMIGAFFLVRVMVIVAGFLRFMRSIVHLAVLIRDFKNTK